MKTGLESLDTGAPKITYSGNEGPKAPQQMQMAGSDRYFKILEFKINELEGELGRDLTDEEYEAVSKEAYEELSSGARAPRGIESMKMASYRPGEYSEDEIEMYEKYKYDMNEQKPGMPIMDIDEFLRQEYGQGRVDVADGGVMQLVKKNADGSRPGYRGVGGYRGGPGGSGGGVGREQAGTKAGSPSERDFSTGPNVGRSRNETPADDRSSPLQTYRTKEATGKLFDEDYETIDEVPLNKREQETDTFIDKKADYPKYTPAVVKFLANLNRRPNREFFVNKVLYSGNIPNYLDEDFNIEDAYQKYMSNRMAGKTDAMGRPIEGFSYNSEGELVGGFINNRDDSQGMLSTAMLPPADTTTPLPPPPSGIPVSPVTGQYSNKYVIPSASNFYTNLPSTMFDPTTNTLTLADGGRANFAGGGIADLRQGYFLGKIVKSITKPFKGVFKGIKKVAKSPAGKLALMAALGNIPIGQGGTAFQRLGGMFTGGNKILGPDDSILGTSSIADFFSGLGDKIQANPLNYILGASGLAGIYTALVNKNMPNPFLDYQRRLDEERANFADIPVEPVQFSKGGSAGLPPITMNTESQNIQSFPDDESTGMAQTTPQNQMPMPMRPPMMDPRMQQMMMARGMNPMMNRGIMMNRGMNPMMNTGMPMMGGRMLAQEGGIMYKGGGADMGSVNKKNVNQIRQAILKGIADGLFTFDDLTKYDETGVLPRDEDSTSQRYNRDINLIKPFEGKEIRKPFYPDRFKIEEIREPFYPDRFKDLKLELMAQGGRIGAQEGGIMMASNPDIMDERNELSLKMFEKPIDLLTPEEMDMLNDEVERLMQKFSSAPDPMDERNSVMEMLSERYYGKPLKDLTDDEFIDLEEALEDLTGKKERSAPRVMAQEGGMMDMGGMEKDYRNEGGFVAIGGQERADDVPARLSKNEFVFTADAVRNAGGGDIDKGAEIMENMMENLEAGGKVSQESQGLKGARQMFQTSQRLEEVL